VGTRCLQHLSCLCATGATVDLKKTTYKKLGKLLSVFEKKGLLTQKLVHKQEHLATVNREHALYTAFAALHGSAGAQVLLFPKYWCLHLPGGQHDLARSQVQPPTQTLVALASLLVRPCLIFHVMLRAPG